MGVPRLQVNRKNSISGRLCAKSQLNGKLDASQK
jgi:hypothetical protein